jgi:protein-tyrosine phosphatase
MKCRATVLVADRLSYCIVDTADHLAAVTSYLEQSRMIPVCVEEDELLSKWLQYDAYHLDFGPVIWTQCVRLYHDLMTLSRHGGPQLRRPGAPHSAAAGRPETDDDDTSASSSSSSHEFPGSEKRRFRKGPDSEESGRKRSADCMVVVTVRSYLPLDVLTNVVTALGLVTVISGSLVSADQIHALFPYTSVLSKLLYFHDASPYNDLESLFDLTVEDVLRGALRAMERFGSDGQLTDLASFVELSEHYATLEQGDLNWIVPNEICAFSCPDDSQPLKCSHRYADIFCPLSEHNKQSEAGRFFDSVGCVVQLNSARYKKTPLRSRHIHHRKLIFDDGAVPPESIVEEFFRIVEDMRHESGVPTRRPAVALHCMAGLGRTGTLAAVYLVRMHDFTAREAIAWVRLARPGSVIGPQQHYVVFFEALEKAKRGKSHNKFTSRATTPRSVERRKDAGRRPGSAEASRRTKLRHTHDRDEHEGEQEEEEEERLEEPPLLGRYVASNRGVSERSPVEGTAARRPAGPRARPPHQHGGGDADGPLRPPHVAAPISRPPVRDFEGEGDESKHIQKKAAVKKVEDMKPALMHMADSPEMPRPGLLQYVVGSSRSPTKTPLRRQADPLAAQHQQKKVLPSRSVGLRHGEELSHRSDQQSLNASLGGAVRHRLRAEEKEQPLPAFNRRYDDESGGQRDHHHHHHRAERDDVAVFEDPHSPDRLTSSTAAGLFVPILSRSSSAASSTATFRQVRVNVTL